MCLLLSLLRLRSLLFFEDFLSFPLERERVRDRFLDLLADLVLDLRLPLERDLRLDRLRDDLLLFLDLERDDLFRDLDRDFLRRVLDRDLDRLFLDVDLFREREREWRLDLDALPLERDLLRERDLRRDRDLLRERERLLERDLRLDRDLERCLPEIDLLRRDISESTVPDISFWASLTFFRASSISLAFMFNVGMLAACGLMIADCDGQTRIQEVPS